MKEELPLIINIHRLAVEDGPGLRSTVFFKGCPLACDWCHNPESSSFTAEVAFISELCIDCGVCSVVCPEGAINPVGSDRVIQATCTGCGCCADACPSTALRRVGIQYPVKDLVALLLRDKIYYEVSGGGVTFSGGEPTQHMDYLEAALTSLSREGIHSAIQTCGYFSPAPFIKRILPLVDVVYFDLKIFDPKEHARFCGRENRLILNTFSKLSQVAHQKIIPRIPMIPGRTANCDNLMALAGFLQEHRYRSCDLLSYNPGTIGKRRRIGKTVPRDLPECFLDAEEEKELRNFFTRALLGTEPASQRVALLTDEVKKGL
jgi:pyruvate formate lyase activating enzyme